MKTLCFRQVAMRVLLLVVLLRIFASIPVPFTNPEFFQSLLSENGGLGLFNVLTGNGLSKVSIMTLSITPYITASIVIQLLSVIFPKLHEMQKGMPDDRKKLEKGTLYLGILLGFVESLSMAIGYGRQGLLTKTGFWPILCVALLWTAGTAAASFAGKHMTDKYHVNGISLILLSNIVSSYIPDSRILYQNTAAGKNVAVQIAIIAISVVAIVALFAFGVLVHESEQRIPLNYSAKMGASTTPNIKAKSFLPIKLCPGSVIPVIFASTLFSMPALVASIAGKTWAWTNYFNTSLWFQKAQWKYSIGAILYVLLIIAFSYFYSSISFNPTEVASDLQKQGGTIPGIRPGVSTADYIRRRTRLTTLIGALALSAIALVPTAICAFRGIPQLSFLGTSILITIGVILEVATFVKSERKTVRYQQPGSLFAAKVS